MLDISTDIIRSIIDKAHEFHAQEGVVFPEDPNSPTDDWAMQILANHADDLTFQELRDLIRDLEPDQQMSLVALMWVGRGDFDADEWEEALAQARDRWTRRTAEYLIATPLVADYLEEGLSALGQPLE
ncbi:MAG: DUF3775 domain-containing protein [Gammaproteobacteria bacterium]|nr:DUF3775 domain-containing protein [Gammaproteobacteria bacterium]